MRNRFKFENLWLFYDHFYYPKLFQRLYCLNNWNECQEIIKNAHAEFHANHSWLARAKSLKNEFEKLLRNNINNTIKL